VAREHNVPAYVVFHDATLAEMARRQPDSLEALSAISGVGARKLDAYGPELLRVLGGRVPAADGSAVPLDEPLAPCFDDDEEPMPDPAHGNHGSMPA
jgi:ribonuclease D